MNELLEYLIDEKHIKQCAQKFTYNFNLIEQEIFAEHPDISYVKLIEKSKEYKSFIQDTFKLNDTQWKYFYLALTRYLEARQLEFFKIKICNNN